VLSCCCVSRKKRNGLVLKQLFVVECHVLLTRLLAPQVLTLAFSTDGGGSFVPLKDIAFCLGLEGTHGALCHHHHRERTIALAPGVSHVRLSHPRTELHGYIIAPTRIGPGAKLVSPHRPSSAAHAHNTHTSPRTRHLSI
jgi:hypothetical protein